MTPIYCFRVKELEFWMQDFAGERHHVCTAADERQLEFIVSTMNVFHRVKTLQWDEPDSIAR